MADKPPFRADHVGSLLRPPGVADARKRHFVDHSITAVDISSGMHLRALDRLHRHRAHKIDFIEEIKRGNVAAAIFFSTTLIFAGMVVAIAIS